MLIILYCQLDLAWVVTSCNIRQTLVLLRLTIYITGKIYIYYLFILMCSSMILRISRALRVMNRS